MNCAKSAKFSVWNLLLKKACSHKTPKITAEIIATFLSWYISFTIKYVNNITSKDGISKPKNLIIVSLVKPDMKKRDISKEKPGNLSPDSS